MSLSPNPSDGEVTVELMSSSELKTIDEGVVWEIEVRDQSQNLKYRNAKLRGAKTKINTSS